MLDAVTASASSPAEAATHDLDAVRLAAWRTVRVLSDSVVQRISDELELATGMPLDWYEVLLHIYESGDGSLPQHELDQRSALSQSGISRMVSKMEKANLIRREQAPHDRRNVLVSLTAAGRDAFLRATPVHHMAVQRYFGSKITDEQAEQINAGLSKVTEGVDGAAETTDTAGLSQVITFGHSVLSLTSESMMVSDAVQIRDALEPLILLDASRHVTDESINIMRADVTTMSTLIDRPIEFFQADWELHRHIAACATNQLLRGVYLQLLDVLSSHVKDVVPTTNLTSYLYERLAIHGRLVDAVVSGSADRVRAAADAHHFTDIRSRLVDGRTAG
jgi:DNA-binding MarR family transcriptional regulator